MKYRHPCQAWVCLTRRRHFSGVCGATAQSIPFNAALSCSPLCSGVPPDAFSATGQLWGSPLYDWKAHKAEGFAWWSQRIARSMQVGLARAAGAAGSRQRMQHWWAQHCSVHYCLRLAWLPEARGWAITQACNPLALINAAVRRDTD